MRRRPSAVVMLALAASVAEAQPDASAAAPDAAACQELPAWGVPVGIAMGTVASIGINIGQNLQADGIRNLPESQRETQPWKSKKWQVGQGVFVSFSIVNFAALALAATPWATTPASCWCHWRASNL